MKPNIIENNFRKVLVAAQRARQLEKGARPLIQVANMKATYIALQEVESGLIGFDLIAPKEPAAQRT